MEQLVNLIVTNGTAAAIVAYFLVKDYKFNGQLIDLMTEIKGVLEVVKDKYNNGV